MGHKRTRSKRKTDVCTGVEDAFVEDNKLAGSSLVWAEPAEPEFTIRRKTTPSLFQDGVTIEPLSLRFTDYAWQKLRHFCYSTPTEVSGFGISNDEDPFLVEDFILLRQQSSAAHTDLDGEAIGELVYDMVQAGKEPHQCSRIWIHTHPEMSAHPSATDENTFRAVFAGYDWVIMCIVSMLGDASARIRVTLPSLTFSMELPITIVDKGTCKDLEGLKKGWDAEYKGLVKRGFAMKAGQRGRRVRPSLGPVGFASHEDDLKDNLGGIPTEELETFDALYDMNLDGGWVE